MIAAYCRRTLLIVCREGETFFYSYSLFAVLLLSFWEHLKQSQPNNKIISDRINRPQSLLRSIANSLTVSYYSPQEHSGFTEGASPKSLTFAKRHMKWARACGFGHSSFLMISKLWLSWVNTSTTEQEKRACSEVCWNCCMRVGHEGGESSREVRTVKTRYDSVNQLLYDHIANLKKHKLLLTLAGWCTNCC